MKHMATACESWLLKALVNWPISVLMPVSSVALACRGVDKPTARNVAARRANRSLLNEFVAWQTPRVRVGPWYHAPLRFCDFEDRTNCASLKSAPPTFPSSRPFETPTSTSAK